MEKVAQRKVSETEYYLFQEESDALGLPAWLECLDAILPSSVDRFYIWGIPWMDENKG